MLLFDGLLETVLDYFFSRLEARRDQHDAGIRSMRIAMRALAASLSEISLQLEAGLHKLRRVAGDRESFYAELRTLVDIPFLREACNQAGICEALRTAQDELVSLDAGNSSPELEAVRMLAGQLEAYEIAFVSAIRDFLSQARGFDLTSASLVDSAATPDQILEALDERIQSLNTQLLSIERLLQRLRERALTG